jgi:hypothetical protein
MRRFHVLGRQLAARAARPRQQPQVPPQGFGRAYTWTARPAFAPAAVVWGGRVLGVALMGAGAGQVTLYAMR